MIDSYLTLKIWNLSTIPHQKDRMTASIVNENSLKFISMLSLMFVSLNVKSLITS